MVTISVADKLLNPFLSKVDCRNNARGVSSINQRADVLSDFRSRWVPSELGAMTDGSDTELN